MTQTSTAPRPNSAFIEGSKLQFAWDSTSLGALKECPRKYQLAIVEGWDAKRRSVDLTFGILLHSARERYYHERARGSDHDEALRCGLAYLLVETFDSALGRPTSWDDHPQKNRATLIRSFVWYCDHWREDPLETILLANGKPAVELSFRLQTDFTLNGIPVLLCGHIDRLARFNDRTYVSDLKTTKHTLDQSYFAGFSPDNQMSLYALASRAVWHEPVEGIIIDAVQVAVTFSRFQRGIVPRSEDQLSEFYEGLSAYLVHAQAYADDDFWPMNERACWRCQFRRVCAKPASTRGEWLRADFCKRTWDPLSVRGDI